MNAFWLYRPDGTRTDVSACGVCGKLARGTSNYDLSGKCCTCYDCGLPLAEDERQYANRRLYHHACEGKRRANIDAARLEKAVIVEDYDGPVYVEGYGAGSYGDCYFADVNEFAESYGTRYDVNESPSLPEYVHCCQSAPVAGLDLANILESHCEDMFEDAIDSLNGIDALQAAVDAFNVLNAGVLSWDVDFTRKVAVPRDAA